jgi:hypothetical protein
MKMNSMRKSNHTCNRRSHKLLQSSSNTLCNNLQVTWFKLYFPHLVHKQCGYLTLIPYDSTAFLDPVLNRSDENIKHRYLHETICNNSVVHKLFHHLHQHYSHCWGLASLHKLSIIPKSTNWMHIGIYSTMHIICDSATQINLGITQLSPPQQ